LVVLGDEIIRIQQEGKRGEDQRRYFPVMRFRKA
jgi:hypothetical protein